MSADGHGQGNRPTSDNLNLAKPQPIRSPQHSRKAMRFRSSIQQKILALLIGLALPPLLVAGWLSLTALERARTTAIDEGSGALLAQAETHLAQRAGDKAELYDLALADIRRQVESSAALISAELSRGPFTITSEPVWVPPAPTPLLLERYGEEVAFVQHLVPLLQAAVDANPLVNIGYVALDAGGVIAFDDPAVIAALLKIQPFDPRTRPWYLAAHEAGATVWTDTYVDANTGLLTTTCAAPIYTADGSFVGVVAFDLLLRTIQQDLLAVDIGGEGYALLINQNGTVIVRPNMEAQGEPWDQPFRSENLLNSSSAELRAVVARMVAREQGVARINDNGPETVIAFAPIPTSGWNVALVVPAEQLGEPAISTGQRIAQRQSELQLQLQILLLGLILLIAVLGILLSFSFSRRISTVREGVQTVAGGDLSRRLPPAGTDEIGQLVEAFNQMAGVLQSKLHELEQNADQMATLNSLATEVKSMLDLHVLLEAIPTAVCTRLGFDHALLYLVEGHQIQMVAMASAPNDKGEDHQTYAWSHSDSLELGQASLEADVIRSGKAIIVEAQAGERSYVAVPIFGREGRVIGLLVTDCRHSRRLISVEEVGRLLMFAGMVGLSIENLQLLNNLERQVTERTVELREALAAAHLADKRKSDLLASLSHELRTPLNAIIGFSTVMLDGIDGSLTLAQREDLTSINRNGRFLLHLITELLDLARIEAGHLQLELTEVDLHNLIGDVVDTVQGLLRTRPLVLRAELPVALPLVRADPDRTRQVLLNLLSNAVKFTPRGAVTVSAAVIDEVDQDGQILHFVAVHVADTGIGIPMEQHGAIFEEFVQIHGRQSRINGTGLGLAIARRLIEAQHGRIWVESEPGHGSIFSFTLPVVA